jgi:hypothetical protein
MKHSLVALFALLFVPALAPAQQADEQGVRAAVNVYLRGHATGNGDEMRKAFLPMERATLVHGATTFTDYFVLLKVDGEWKIANKVYSSRPTK